MPTGKCQLCKKLTHRIYKCVTCNVYRCEDCNSVYQTEPSKDEAESESEITQD